MALPKRAPLVQGHSEEKNEVEMTGDFMFKIFLKIILILMYY